MPDKMALEMPASESGRTGSAVRGNLFCRWDQAAGKANELQVFGALEKGIGDVRRLFSGEILFAEELMSFGID